MSNFIVEDGLLKADEPKNLELKGMGFSPVFNFDLIEHEDYYEPTNIQIMKKPFVSNFYDGYITKDYKVEFANAEFDVDILSLFPGAKIDENEVLIDDKGNEIDVVDMEINVEVPFEAITISDDPEASDIHGHIISLIYLGDHYEIMVRTDEEEDFILNSPDLWNENDEVSVIIDKSQIHLSRKGAKK